MSDDLADLLQAEEAKRLRNWDAAERWKVLQETLGWMEQQSTVRRNTREAALREQNRELAGIGLLEPTAEQLAFRLQHDPK
jgi:hypothetical protein